MNLGINKFHDTNIFYILRVEFASLKYIVAARVKFFANQIEPI